MKRTRAETRFSDSAREKTPRRPGLASTRSHKGVCNSATSSAAPARARIESRANSDNQATTRVSAKVDVGWGNTLFIRGEGAGLSWDIGQPLQCVEETTWIWVGRQTPAPITFKLLINDQLWCRGENMTAAPGTRTDVAPLF